MDLNHRPLPNKKQCFLRVFRPFKAILEHQKYSKTIKFAVKLREKSCLIDLILIILSNCIKSLYILTNMDIIILTDGKEMIQMSPLAKELELNLIEQEKHLFKELDKSIDQMEQGQAISLNESIARIREKLEIHEV